MYIERKLKQGNSSSSATGSAQQGDDTLSQNTDYSDSQSLSGSRMSSPVASTLCNNLMF